MMAGEGVASALAAVSIPEERGTVAFFLARTPVTNAEYAPAIDDGVVPVPPWWGDPDFHGPRRPVVGVSWEDASAYCAWLTGTAGGRWRLPTEAEWERAASGGLVRPRTPWGETVPAGEIPEGPLAGPWETGWGRPNPYGLCDMGTVVHEWCADWRSPGRRASRGGSWRHAIRWSSPWASSSLPPTFRYSDYGFRPLRDLDR
jgi:formylglycine-generating enzyme required for sulfatase activity